MGKLIGGRAGALMGRRAGALMGGRAGALIFIRLRTVLMTIWKLYRESGSS